MRDQAQGLRILAPTRSSRSPVSESAAHQTPVFTVGSGKGGVGKSVLSVLLAQTLARQGHRVLLFDGAQLQGNLHILLGVRPAAPLTSVLYGEREPESLLHPLAANLWLLPAPSGAEDVYALSALDRARLHHRLCEVYDGFDAVVLDCGAGLESAARISAGAGRATQLAVVTTPEPAALADAYALIKIVHLQAPSLPMHVVVNRTQHPDEGQATFARLAVAASRFLQRELSYAGCVAEHDVVRQAVRAPGSLLGLQAADCEAVAGHLWGSVTHRPAVAARAPTGECGLLHRSA